MGKIKSRHRSGGHTGARKIQKGHKDRTTDQSQVNRNQTLLGKASSIAGSLLSYRGAMLALGSSAIGAYLFSRSQPSSKPVVNSEEDCNRVKDIVASRVEDNLLATKSYARRTYGPSCATEEKIRSHLEGASHQELQSCYFHDKKALIDDGNVVFFQEPYRTKGYNPAENYNLLTDLENINKQSGKEVYKLSKIPPSHFDTHTYYTAVSNNAPSEAQRAFKDYFLANDRRLPSEKQFSALMMFEYMAGQAEVPTFDRALYSMFMHGGLPSVLSDGVPDEPINIPAKIVSEAIKNDENLSITEKNQVISKLSQSKGDVNIGKGANDLGRAIREAIKSIQPQCNSISGDREPLRSSSLTGTSLYFPMEWDNSALKSLASKTSARSNEL